MLTTQESRRLKKILIWERYRASLSTQAALSDERAVGLRTIAARSELA